MNGISRSALTLLTTVFAIALFCLTACEKTENNPPAENASTLQLYLTDNPADYKSVWIDIEKVMVHLSGDTLQQSGWRELPVLQSGKYDLLALRNGADTLLAAAEVPAGRLTEIRLLLGSDNSIVLKDGDSSKLFIPTDKDNGKEIILKVEHFLLKPGVPFELVLDFNLAKSISEPARPDSGEYRLNPFIHVFAKGAGASIQGWVFPDSANAHVLAISPNKDTLSAIPNDVGGFYKFWGIPDGQYTLLFLADSTTGYKNDTLTDIQATEGHLFRGDTVRLHK